MAELKHVYNTKNKVRIGDFDFSQFLFIAGPCAVESEDQIVETAELVKKNGAIMLRGSAYKPRTSPYSFQGLGREGLLYLKTAKEKTGLPIVTEVLDTQDVELVAQYADVLQIGARNMQNFALLKACGRIRKPILLKRGLSGTVEELLNSAEYIMNEGNMNVMLCERGIRTFETVTRNTLDVCAIAYLKKNCNLPVIVDPSHAAGIREYVIPLALAGVAAGADGIIVEVHPEPDKALVDGAQSLTAEMFLELVEKTRKLKQIK